MSRKSRRAARIQAAKAAPKAGDPAPLGEFRATGAAAVIRAADESGDGPKIATFTGLAYTGAPMRPEGWWRAIVVDLAGVKVPSQHRPVLRQHDPEQICGHTTEVKITDKGIEIAGAFSGQAEHTAKVVDPASKGFQWQLSIGATPVRIEELDAGAETEVNGRTVVGPLTISRETVLGEVSFVPLGADGDTSAVVSATKGSLTMFRAMLKAAKAHGSVRAAKFSDDQIDQMTEDEAKAALKECQAEDPPKEEESKAKAKAEDGEKKTEAEDGDGEKTEAKSSMGAAAIRAAALREHRAAIASEERRAAAIRAHATKYGVSKIKAGEKEVDFIPHAIEQGWDNDKAELEAMRAARPGPGVGGPHLHLPGAPELSDEVLEAAVLQASNCALLSNDFFDSPQGERGRLPRRDADKIKAEMNRRYPEKVQDHAHRLFKSRIGLQQLYTIIAREGGYKGRESISTDNFGEVAAACIRADGSSTLSVSNVTANVLNKFLLVGYLFTERSWSEICARRSVKDFKPTKSINLFGDVEFADVGPSGELKNASLQDQAFANQVTTSGRILTIPRPTFINDDLSAFSQVPVMLGRGAGLKLNKSVWSTLLSPGYDDGGSTNFFATTHTISGQSANANYASGGTTALSSSSLNTAVTLFDKQVDPKGYPLGVDAEILLYPPELDATALPLMNSDTVLAAGLASTSAHTVAPVGNVWKGRFKPVKSRYLSNTAFTGYSLTAWYLFANPNILPVIEVAFLNGQEMPTVQQAGPDFQFNVLGITTRAFFDIGVAMQNFRGAVKMAGA